MLREEDSEHYSAVGGEERGEFLFRLFKHLCLGGDSVSTKTPSNLTSTPRSNVQRDPDTKRISVVSTVIKVSAYDKSGRCFPGTREEEQTFAYLIVDPYKRHVTLFCHFYGVGNFTQ
ncbi:unnamed protein product [Pleuronectes platessa]|uniref:Cilia- and flagella-associated protein 300 n=1 Tax=Pleuronectes platessa TaxID=8262 RepID=A0A9N7YY07_PLEPL|nr:unnamed protein product [Pleuronectes platessa]